LKILVLIVVLVASTATVAESATYEWLRENERLSVILCPHGGGVDWAKRTYQARKATNGGYFYVVRGVYVPVGRLYYHGRRVYNFKAPKRGWIFRDASGKCRLSPMPPPDPKSCDYAREIGSVLVEKGKAKTRHEIGLYGEEHRYNHTERNVFVFKNGRIGNYHTTGPLWKVAKTLEKDGIEIAVNGDGGRSMRPKEKVADIFVFLPAKGDKHLVAQNTPSPLHRALGSMSQLIGSNQNLLSYFGAAPLH